MVNGTEAAAATGAMAGRAADHTSQCDWTKLAGAKIDESRTYLKPVFAMSSYKLKLSFCLSPKVWRVCFSQSCRLGGLFLGLLLLPVVRGATAPVETEQSRILEQINRLRLEQSLLPSAKNRLRLLQKKLSTTDGLPVSGPALPPQNPLPLPSDESTPQLRAGSYLEFIGFVKHNLPRHLTDSPEHLVKRGNLWLSRHPSASPERTNIQFLTRQVWPGWEEFLPQLILRRPHLLGLAIPAGLHAGRTIEDIGLDGLLLSQQTSHGTASIRISWRQLPNLEIVRFLGEQAFTGSPMSPADPYPYYAFLLCNSEFSRLRRLLNSPAQAAQRPHWLSLIYDLENWHTETQALQLWRNAQELRLIGDRSQAYQQLLKLTRLDSRLAEVHRREIELLKEQCLPSTPASQAVRLIDSAQKILTADPTQALWLLHCAYSRYGELSFPEKSRIALLRDQTLSPLSAESAEPLIAWQVAENPSPAFAQLQKWQQSSPAFSERALSQLKAAVLLAAGDWYHAPSEMGSLRPEKPSPLPPALAAPVCFAKGLLGLRLGQDRTSAAILQELAKLAQQAGLQDPALAIQISTLLVEYAILAREHRLSGSLISHLYARISRQPGLPATLQKRFFFSTLVWLLQADRLQETTRLLEQLMTPARTDSLSLTPEERQTLQAVHSWLGQHDSPAAAADTWQASSPALQCLLIAALSRRPALPGGLPPSLTGTPKPGSGPLGGKVWYEHLLLKLSYHLQTGNISQASADLILALDLSHPATSTYYPDLCFLKAGLEILQNQNMQAMETLGHLSWASVASASEKELAECWREARLRRVKAIVPKQAQSFWHVWLSCMADWSQEVPLDNRQAIAELAAKAQGEPEIRLARAMKVLSQGQPNSTVDN
jgi:hypothetical protein